jgi:hypothetical protein
LEASKTKTHGRHRHKFGLSGRWIEVVFLVAAVYLSPLALCTSWKPSCEAPAQSWIEGRMDVGSLKNNNMGSTGTNLGLSGRWIEVVVSCCSGISEPIGLVYPIEPSWEAPAQSWIEGVDFGSLKKI